MKNQPIKTLLTHRCKLTCPCRKQLNTTQSHSRERFTLLMTEYKVFISVQILHFLTYPTQV